jgi:hypothetical protein
MGFERVEQTVARLAESMVGRSVELMVDQTADHLEYHLAVKTVARTADQWVDWLVPVMVAMWV